MLSSSNLVNAATILFAEKLSRFCCDPSPKVILAKEPVSALFKLFISLVLRNVVVYDSLSKLSTYPFIVYGFDTNNSLFVITSITLAEYPMFGKLIELPTIEPVQFVLSAI